GVEPLFFLVVAAQSLAELMQRIDTLPRSKQGPFAGDFGHQLVDKFKLFERRPAGIPCPPVRTRPQPHRKGLGEILVRMALRIPEPKMLDITPAGRIGPIVPRVGFRGQAEQLLPASAAVQLVGLLHRMAGLMTENGHALGPSAALDVEHHLFLELHQAGMGEIEWDSGVLSGLNHSLDIHAWGRSRIPRSSSSSWRLLTQSSSQVPSTVTLRLLRRRLSNCSSDSVSQAYFRR